jgi:predicted AAA+ superfamily ATPase
LFFDLGIRRLAAQEGIHLPKDKLGQLFEQFVGLELLRQGRISGHHYRLQFWRDPDGPEVDWVVNQQGTYTPIEVKWSATPTERDARHIQVFQKEYANAEMGYIVCQAKRKFKLADRIMAIPWQEMPTLIN